MKKVVLFIILMLCGILNMKAQHLRFSGIPIEGSITSFQSKLSTKGIRINQAKSSDAPVGQRIFNGKFQGYNSEITVFYNRKTKDVYKVEVEIESSKKEVIQGILDRAIKTIEQKYAYNALHDLEDGTKLHFQYYIYPTKESEDCSGIIHIKPSYAYYIPNNANEGQRLQFASYIITFVYEDAINTSALTPSTTEPKSLRSFTCGTPENFSKFLLWADNYRKNECYEKCIYYLQRVLDYYKYGCVPQGMDDYEEVLDQAIIAFQSRKIGTIKTAYHKEFANVFFISDETTNSFKYIEFGVNSDMYQIKLDASDIATQISVLEELKQAYVEKKTSIAGIQLNDYWRENIDLSMPALLGYDRLRDGFGDIEWRKLNLTMRFTQFNQQLRVEVNFDEYKEIFLFCNETEIDNYLFFLKSVPIDNAMD